MSANIEQFTKNELLNVERLEFGKFCVSPEGSVLRDNGTVIEYSLLGKSAEFPSELINHCKPRILDIEAENEEQISNTFPHGTILRPFVSNKTIQTVFFRVRRRFEDGESVGSGRRYKIGRYLTAINPETHPLIFLRAMEQLPLTGITLENSRRIEALSIKKHVPGEDFIVDAFVKKAVAFILSGIAVDVSEKMPEDDFFRCVFCLWSALPLKLRPLLSAGWGVSRRMANDFAISCCQGQSKSRAYFSADSQEWHPPFQVIKSSGGQTTFVDFASRLIKPGEAYAQQLFKTISASDNSEFASLDATNVVASPILSSWFNELPEVELTMFPTWQDQSVLKIFRSPGLKALDANTLEKFETWLSNGEGEPPFLDVKKFFFYPNRQRAFETILEMLAETNGTVERAELALWHSLSGQVPDNFIETLHENLNDNKKRALFFASLQTGKVAETLYQLMVAAQHEEAEMIPEYVREALFQLLDKSLIFPEKKSLTYHDLLFCPGTAPSVYRAWREVNKRRMVMVMAQELEGLSTDTYARINEVIFDPLVNTICNLQFGRKPILEDASTIANATAEEQRWLGNFLCSLWQNSAKMNQPLTRREELLQWLDLINIIPNDDLPLWNIYFKQPVKQRQLALIYWEVEENLVPSSMKDMLAAFVLHYWDLFTEQIRNNLAGWSEITARFPRIFRKIIINEPLRETTQPIISQEIKKALENFSVTSTEADRIITAWIQQPSDQNFETARFLWEKLIETGEFDYSGGIANLCRQMQNGHLPVANDIKQIPLEQINILAQLIRLSKADESLKKNLVEWWQRLAQIAETERSFSSSHNLARQIIILLSVFRQSNFKPTVKQLEVLVLYRQWLKEHLRENINHPKRSETFRIATREFHELNFNKSIWSNDYSNTVLWAVYKGVPLELQHPQTLSQVLKYYSQVNSYSFPQVISIRADMCHSYLNNYPDFPENPEIRQQALTKVVKEGLIPLLHKNFNSRERVIRAVEDAKNLWFGKEGILGLGSKILTLGLGKDDIFRINPKSLEDLLRLVLEEYGYKNLIKALDEYFIKWRRGINGAAR